MTSKKRLSLSEYFSALLAHDISNYNQISRGYLEMLSSEQLGSLNERQARSIAKCLRQSHRVQSLINSVRLVDQLEQTPSKIEEINLDQIIRQALEKIQVEFSDREIRLHFTAAGRIALAEQQLEAVFVHLMDNAVRYNKCEVVEIEITFKQKEETPPMWRILIGDNGNGISPTKQDFLFTRIQEREIHGCGLGLSMAKFLIERWSGNIWLERSNKEEGTIFCITIPCQP